MTGFLTIAQLRASEASGFVVGTRAVSPARQPRLVARWQAGQDGRPVCRWAAGEEEGDG